MGYNAKNYTEQGGDVTRIGGKLIIEEGGSVEGLPESANVPASKADTVAKLKDDFNALLTVLKDAGYVAKDQFALGSNLIPSPAEEALAANHAKVASVSYENGEITVAADVDDLTAFPSSEPSQGTHKWIGLEVKTGAESIVGILYDGDYALTQGDADEAESVGCAAGSFVLYIRAEEAAVTPKTITLGKAGYEAATVAIRVAKPE